jgi:hypothetical protein
LGYTGTSSYGGYNTPYYGNDFVDGEW